MAMPDLVFRTPYNEKLIDHRIAPYVMKQIEKRSKELADEHLKMMADNMLPPTEREAENVTSSPEQSTD